MVSRLEGYELRVLNEQKHRYGLYGPLFSLHSILKVFRPDLPDAK